MGICTSCEATAVSPATTAKLILQDGELREFDRPVRISNVLPKDPAWFVCDSDEMEFDGFVSAVRSDEELRPGQLYFVLPRSMLNRRFKAEDLAALALKASAALMKAATGCGKPLVFAAAGSAVAERRKGGKKASNDRGCNFASNLCAIPE